MEQKIPKVIHFCWFGHGEYPELIVKCMETWKKYLPEYEIVKWSEDNFDINSNQYVKEAYENKKWAFVTDYVRLYALYTCGGIYLDSDVEILKPIDEFLDNEAFSGFESKDTVPTAIMGAVKGQRFIGELMHEYDERRFILEDGSFDMKTNTVAITQACIRHGLELNGKKQTIEGCTFYPPIYFCPNTIGRIVDRPSRKSYTIHHSAGTWSDDKVLNRTVLWKAKRYAAGRLRALVGTENIKKIKRTLGLYGRNEK